MYKVLLVDDEEMLLDSLEIILSLKNMKITGKAHDGNEALEILSKESCDIALVDLNMKGMGGIELIGHIKKDYPDIKILVLTTFYDDRNITEAIGRGADGYLLKDSGKESIFGAVEQIMSGSGVLDPKVMQRLTSLVSGRSADRSEVETDGGRSVIYGELTEKEKEIAVLLSEGLNNKQIASELYISEGTVKNYISSIYDKTGIHDRVKLAMMLK